MDKGDSEAARESRAAFTDFTVGEAPEHEVRYISGDTVYVEALVDGQWVGRYWAADGRIYHPYGAATKAWEQYNFPYWRKTDPAFEFRIRDNPAGDLSVDPSTFAPSAEGALMSSSSEGLLLSKGWRWESYTEEPATERGARHFVVELSNTARPVGVKVHTLLNGTPVLTRWLEITNASRQSVALTTLAPWSGRLWAEGDAFTLGHQDAARFGARATSTPTSGWFAWDPLPNGTTRAATVDGNSRDDPFFVVRSEQAGEYFICHLSWTANWRMEFERSQLGLSHWPGSEKGLSFKIGPSSVNALRVIGPGETIVTPAVHLGHVKGDFDSTVQAMHDHLRRFVLPSHSPQRSYLMEYSIPGDQGYYVGPAFNQANLIRSIDVAAELGMELFMVDGGWWDVYGEFVPSPDRFPRGLEPVAEYAHKKGLLFGLYTEVEGGRGNWSESKLAREHPDWLGPQNIMRLDKPEVAAYVESELVRIIERYGLDLYRHDFIPAPSPIDRLPHTREGASELRDGFVESSYWRHYENYYAIWERIRARFPDLILQMCSNGGWREDLDMMGQFHETYTSEGPPLTVLAPYSGKTVALPPEIIVIGFHGDSHLRATFSVTAPWILSGAAPSVDELSPARRERYLRYADIYKSFIRPLWSTCKVYHHSPVSSRGGAGSSPWFAIEYAAPDRTRGWATIVRLGPSESDTYVLRPRGLDPGRSYRVTFDSMRSTATVDGISIVREGLPIRLEGIEASELLLFEAL